MRSANCDCRETERERAACIFNLLVSVSEKPDSAGFSDANICFLAPISSLCFYLRSELGRRRVLFKYEHYKVWQLIVASPICKYARLAEHVSF